MRIRKRLALSSIPTAAFSDLQLQRSEVAPPSDPPEQPSHQSVAILSKESRWVFPKNEEKMKQKEFGVETLRMEATKNSNNDIRKIVHICDGDGGNQGFNTSLRLHPSSSFSSSSSVQESRCEENYDVVPLKKRKGSFQRNPNEETMSAKMKSKTNKKCSDIVGIDHHNTVIKENGVNCSSSGKSKRGSVIMEGSRCSRVNGRGWRCCQPTLVGYSLCEHHLGKGRLRRGGASPGRRSEVAEEPLMMVTKRRTKVGVVKARSMSSLLSQI